MKTTQLSMAAAITFAAATAASAQEACTSYTVQPGDSLSAIARTAYGNISFQQVWDANRTQIGSNPNSISVGMTLRLPCADGSLPGESPAVAAAPAPAPVAPASGPLNIRLVTGSDYPPFTEESMEGGGVFTQLVRAAADAVAPQAQTSVTFVNDWGSHMDVLLPSGAFDGTFPWVLPDCEAASLTDDMQARCDNYLFADPVYEIVTGLVTRADDVLATAASADAFRGKRVCVPEGYAAILLAGGGLTESDVTYVRPTNPSACFTELAAGNLDAVEMELSQAADIVGKLGLTDQITVNDQLTSISVLTVYVHKENPRADEILSTINSGIEAIRQNGKWFEVVQAGFAAYYAQ
ncbi:LysM peptidoglycan-binding domain-containing protein [Yoonia tamlensis]|nr:transporter substrate-binding domain-containing protein [Yoonia tamlensis]